MATTNFPTSFDTISSLPNPGSGDITTAPSHASQHDVENDALRAIEAKVGIGASTPTANKVLRATGTGTTAYAQVGLTTDVTGTLPAANGGTGITSLGSGVATFLGTPSSANLASAVTDETGSGLLVFNSSPTIVTPTIASFTNAQHNHSNAAGGGQLAATAFANNAITAPLLATDAITLGYAQITGNFSTNSTTATLITGLSTTVTIPAGGRRIKITGFSSDLYASTTTGAALTIWDGTVGSGTQLARGNGGYQSGSSAGVGFVMAIVIPSTGSKTYSIGLNTFNAGTSANIEAAATYPAFILVEAI